MTSEQPTLLVETSGLQSLAEILASRIAVGGEWHMRGVQIEHIEGRRTSVEGIQIHGRTYHEHVNLGAMHAWLSGMSDKLRLWCTFVDSLLGGLPLFLYLLYKSTSCALEHAILTLTVETLVPGVVRKRIEGLLIRVALRNRRRLV